MPDTHYYLYASANNSRESGFTIHKPSYPKQVYLRPHQRHLEFKMGVTLTIERNLPREFSTFIQARAIEKPKNEFRCPKQPF